MSIREQFLEHQKKLAHLAHIQALLQWDQEACMPSKAGEGRAEQIGYIAGLFYELSIAPDYQDILAACGEKKNTFESRQQRSVMLASKELHDALAVDKQFIEEFEMTKSRAQQVRFEARKTNDFQLFVPHLERIIVLSRQYAQAIAPHTDPYNTLLDIYEEGATQDWYDHLLLPLQQPLTDLLHTVAAGRGTDQAKSWLTSQETKELLHELCQTVGFDFGAGMLGEVHHPFMTTLGGYDYRINTRYDHPVQAITGMIHELGHGLYEQWNDPKFHYTNLHYGASTGMHESQSRTLENMIGRSSGMSNYLDQLSKKYGKTYTGNAAERYAVCNDVHPSLIRIEADEISYGLHILLRYELEKELISGRLGVKELPALWNQKMQQYLGVSPTNDAEGCLQDVHWSCGLFGYFPTYLLGNIYAGQLWAAFTQATPHREIDIAQGKFDTYFHRYKDHIWQWGRSLTPADLIQKVTQQPLNANYFLQYLKKKFC